MPSKYGVGLTIEQGLDGMDIIRDRVPRPVTTIFGDPSNELIKCTIEEMDCAIMPRDAITHYRANVWVLKEAECTHVIDLITAGSLKEDIKTGDFLMSDCFLDLANSRSHTFFDGKPGSLPDILLCPINPSVCEPLRKFLIEASQQAGVQCKDGGVGVTIKGFSTKACCMYRTLGGDFVTICLSSDAILCKQTAMLYVCITFVACYYSWKDGSIVNAKVIRKLKAANKDKIEKLIATCQTN